MKKNFVTTTYTWYKNETVAFIVQPPEQISGPAKYSLGGIEEIKQLIVCPLPPSPLPSVCGAGGTQGTNDWDVKDWKSWNKIASGIKEWFEIQEDPEIHIIEKAL